MLASQLPVWACQWTLVTDLGEAGQPIGHGQTLAVSGDGKQGLIKNTNLYTEKL